MEFKILNRIEFEEYIPKFLELYRNCFSGEISCEDVIWRYLNNPLEEILVCVAIDDNKMVSNYAVSPCRLKYKDSILKSALSLNTMTHPEYTGRGLFVQLATMLYEYMTNKGYELVYGFPNYISNRTLNNKLGWSTIYEIPTMCKSIEDIKSEQLNLLKSDNSFELCYENLKYTNEKKIKVLKTNEYLKWRYCENPKQDYVNFVINSGKQINAFVVCKEYEDKINIVDINFENLNQAQQLIRSVIDYGIQCNKREVTVWCNIHDEFHSLLEKMMFKNSYPITYFGARVLSTKENIGDLMEYKNWFISPGDNNVY